MTNLIDALHIPDTQSAHDDRRLAIQRVGIRGVRYPLQLRIEGAVLPGIATLLQELMNAAEAGGRPVEVVAPPSTKQWVLDVVVPVPDLADLGQGLQRAVDRRETDRLAAVGEHPVHLLGAAELGRVLQQLRHGGSLTCRALHRYSLAVVPRAAVESSVEPAAVPGA